MQFLYMVGNRNECPLRRGVCLREVAVSEVSTVLKTILFAEDCPLGLKYLNVDRQGGQIVPLLF